MKTKKNKNFNSNGFRDQILSDIKHIFDLIGRQILYINLKKQMHTIIT